MARLSHSECSVIVERFLGSGDDNRRQWCRTYMKLRRLARPTGNRVNIVERSNWVYDGQTTVWRTDGRTDAATQSRSRSSSPHTQSRLSIGSSHSIRVWFCRCRLHDRHLVTWSGTARRRMRSWRPIISESIRALDACPTSSCIPSTRAAAVLSCFFFSTSSEYSRIWHAQFAMFGPLEYKTVEQIICVNDFLERNQR